MNRQGAIAKILLVILLVVCLLAVIGKIAKEPPYRAHITCQNGNCFAFVETGRKNLWFELCRRTNLALKELGGFLKERKGKADEL